MRKSEVDAKVGLATGKRRDKVSGILNNGGSPVTTIVGITCSNGLVIASDSKATKGASAREEFLKIWDLEVGKYPAVITGAGTSAFISKYREFLEASCRARVNRQPIQSVREFIELAEGTMQDLGRQYGTERLARLGLLRIGGDDDGDRSSVFGLLPHLHAVIGVYGDKPHLFFITPDGIAEEQQVFGATGSGGPYCEYLLPRLCHEGITIEEAAICAIYIIEQVKHVDPHSGGSTQVATITQQKVKHWTSKEIATTTVAAQAIDDRASALWRRSVRAASKARPAKKKGKKT